MERSKMYKGLGLLTFLAAAFSNNQAELARREGEYNPNRYKSNYSKFRRKTWLDGLTPAQKKRRAKAKRAKKARKINYAKA